MNIYKLKILEIIHVILIKIMFVIFYNNFLIIQNGNLKKKSSNKIRIKIFKLQFNLKKIKSGFKNICNFFDKLTGLYGYGKIKQNKFILNRMQINIFNQFY